MKVRLSLKGSVTFQQWWLLYFKIIKISEELFVPTVHVLYTSFPPIPRNPCKPHVIGALPNIPCQQFENFLSGKTSLTNNINSHQFGRNIWMSKLITSYNLSMCYFLQYSVLSFLHVLPCFFLDSCLHCRTKTETYITASSKILSKCQRWTKSRPVIFDWWAINLSLRVTRTVALWRCHYLAMLLIQNARLQANAGKFDTLTYLVRKVKELAKFKISLDVSNASTTNWSVTHGDLANPRVQ